MQLSLFRLVWEPEHLDKTVSDKSCQVPGHSARPHANHAWGIWPWPSWMPHSPPFPRLPASSRRAPILWSELWGSGEVLCLHLQRKKGFPGGASDIKSLPAKAGDLRNTGSLSQEDPLEEGMATHSSILAWRNPWTEEPGGLQSIGSQRVEHDWSDLACTHQRKEET